MDAVAKDGSLSKSTLKGFKAFASSMFKEAKRLGYSDVNPVVDALVDPASRGAADTYAYSLEEIEAILALLPDPASTIFAIAAYAGLRRGEIEALRWENYRDGNLHVEQSYRKVRSERRSRSPRERPFRSFLSSPTGWSFTVSEKAIRPKAGSFRRRRTLRSACTTS